MAILVSLTTWVQSYINAGVIITVWQLCRSCWKGEVYLLNLHSTLIITVTLPRVWLSQLH